MDEDRHPRVGVGQRVCERFGHDRKVGAAVAQRHRQRQRAVAGEERIAEVGVEGRERKAPAR